MVLLIGGDCGVGLSIRRDSCQLKAERITTPNPTSAMSLQFSGCQLLHRVLAGFDGP